LKLKFDKAKDMPLEYDDILTKMQNPRRDVNFKILEKKRENDVFKQGAGQGRSVLGKMSEFIETKNNLGASSKKMAYLHDHRMNRIYPKLSSFDKNNLLSEILRRKDLKLTIWSHFTRTP
tara:strand:- start:300 stop:659 length:360 start_codon:yes stop_codon:yes gene_type:complete